ncbi:phage tail tape measure protein [Mangrovihabitans endophyticus]|uniref:Phage tail tape measure protein domain-containing protein n=1 Tax=Mangrovihabitans endophyticus TaxID=1751298 RepID=A0A8J3FN54_9ACTN|nr:phage tail tape measure protein [Mangrovihabitans endophyticus]GGK89110.1 hypothetical protein GCM10012284_23940 [Mangrovihabitans endophyticus]
MATLEDLLIELGIDTRRVGKDAKEAQGKLGKAWDGAKKLTAAAGVAIGAALISGVTTLIEQSEPAALLQAQLGAGTPLAANAGKAAGAVFARGVVGSMEDAADAVKAAVQNSLVAGDAPTKEIDRVAAKVANLSKVMGEDAGRVSQAVSQMVRTGIAKSSEQAFDILQTGVEKGINKSEDLLDTFNEYGTQFRKLGLQGPQALGLMSQALQAGARDSDTVADALKELSIRAIDGSKTTAGGFKALGLNADTMARSFARGGDYANEALSVTLERLRAIKNPVQQQAAAVALFGTKAEDLGAALFAMDPETATKGLGDLAGSAQRAGDALEQSAGAKLKHFQRAAQQALVEQLAKAVPAIEATFGWLSKNSDWVVPLATGLGILAAAIAVVVAVQWAWNAAMALSPVTWIIIGIVALVAAIALIATKTTWFQTIWQKVWGFFKAVGAWFAGPFAGFFVMLGNKIASFAKWAWSMVARYFGFWYGLFGKVMSWGGNAVNWLRSKWNSFVSWIRGIPGRIAGSLRNMWNAIPGGFRAAMNAVIGRWNRLSFRIPSVTIFGQTIGGGTISTPNIPYLAEGGVVPATPGGRLIVAGEGGEDEVVAPVSKLPSLEGRSDRPIVVEVHGNETDFRRWLRKSIRVRGPITQGAGA